MKITSRTKPADIQCVLLARCGFSYKMIAARTGLSHSQIALRIKQTNSFIKHYRNGESPLANRVADTVDHDITAQIAEIRKQIALTNKGKYEKNP